MQSDTQGAKISEKPHIWGFCYRDSVCHSATLNPPWPKWCPSCHQTWEGGETNNKGMFSVSQFSVFHSSHDKGPTYILHVSSNILWFYSVCVFPYQLLTLGSPSGVLQEGISHLRRIQTPCLPERRPHKQTVIPSRYWMCVCVYAHSANRWTQLLAYCAAYSSHNQSSIARPS